MTQHKAFAGCDIFDGYDCHQHCALLTDNGRVTAIVDESGIPGSYQITELHNGLLTPGFVDLQVNGGGGVLLNDQPGLAAIEQICATHCRFGTTSLLPTLITDTPQVTAAAVDAGIAAFDKRVPGFVGLHLEGPHLCTARKGAHDETLIRKMTSVDLQLLLDANDALPNLLVTVAPESVTHQQITTLTQAGVIISLGHTDATLASANGAIDAGARCITHLYNAMSPLGHREPGLVGCALTTDNVYAGLIADGFHVDKTAISIALAAKKQPGRIFLVTDAMATIGTELKSFRLNGRTIYRTEGRLLLEDGTLAGADLSMDAAIRNMIKLTGTDQFEALKMASRYPAECLKINNEYGHLKAGAKANLVHLDNALTIQQVWQNGTAVTTEVAN